jgi:ParB-like chromosome segregation protein Spo0J
MSGKRPEPTRETLFIENVTVPAHRARGPDAAAVKRLAESLAKIGLQTPISVRMDGDDLLLVAGLHRLEAARSLGWDRIDAVYIDGDERDARLWEISENLHRADLTVLERDEHVAEWIALTAGAIGASCANSSKPGPKGAVRAAARDLGVDRDDARRAQKVASLPEDAKQAARDVGLDDNRSALLAAAKAPDPAEELRRMRREKDADEAKRRNAATDSAIRIVAANEYAEWLMGRLDLAEVPTLLSWIEGSKPKDVATALRRLAA